MKIYKTLQKDHPYVKLYKQQIDYYNWTAYNILQNEMGLILPSFNNRKKRFLTTILGTKHLKS